MLLTFDADAIIQDYKKGLSALAVGIQQLQFNDFQ